MTLIASQFDQFALVSLAHVPGENPDACTECGMDRGVYTHTATAEECGRECAKPEEHHTFVPHGESQDRLRSAIGPFVTLGVADEFRLSLLNPEEWALVRLTHPVDVAEAERLAKHTEGA